MTKNSLIILFVAVLTSFVAGFVVANSFNRNELVRLESELTSAKSESQKNTEQILSNDEIKQKIAEADNNPDNLEFQKTLGIALYKYANLRQETTYFDDISRLLIRANKLDSGNVELLGTLGNLFLDKGISKADNDSFKESRKYYEEALKLQPNNAQIRSNLGSTYLLQIPSDLDKAIAEFKKAIEINKNLEQANEGLIQSYILQNNAESAEVYLKKLKETNSQNATIQDFETQIGKMKSK